MTQQLRFGISRAHGDANVVAASHLLVQALEEAGLEVTLRVAASYAALLDMVRGGSVSFAWLPPLVAARVLSESGSMRAVDEARSDAANDARPTLAAIPIRGGAATYRSGIVVATSAEKPKPTSDAPPSSAPPSSGRFRTVRDLVGCRAAWTDRESAAGYVFPRMYLRAHGIGERDLGEESFVGSSAQACAAVADGRADLCATHLSEAAVNDEARASEELAKQYPAAPWRLRVLAITDPIPADSIVIAGSVDRDARREVTRALLALHDSEIGRRALRELFNAESLAAPTAEVRSRLLRIPSTQAR